MLSLLAKRWKRHRALCNGAMVFRWASRLRRKLLGVPTDISVCREQRYITDESVRQLPKPFAYYSNAFFTHSFFVWTNAIFGFSLPVTYQVSSHQWLFMIIPDGNKWGKESAWYPISILDANCFLHKEELLLFNYDPIHFLTATKLRSRSRFVSDSSSNPTFLLFIIPFLSHRDSDDTINK